VEVLYQLQVEVEVLYQLQVEEEQAQAQAQAQEQAQEEEVQPSEEEEEACPSERSRARRTELMTPLRALLRGLLPATGTYGYSTPCPNPLQLSPTGHFSATIYVLTANHM
jgi:hypothetical protein